MISIVMEMEGKSVGVIPTLTPGESGGPADPSAPQLGGKPEEVRAVGTTVSGLKSSAGDVMGSPGGEAPNGPGSKLAPRSFPQGTMKGKQQGTTMATSGIPAVPPSR